MNRDVVTFFRVLRDDPQELLRVIEATPYAREEYQLSLTTPESPISDMERARRFFVRAWQGFSGSATQKRNGWRYQQKIYPGRDSKVETDWHALERLETAAVRMRHVQIENDDALKVITRFDSPETLFYIDPPYPASTRSKSWGKCAYTHELTTQDHVHLLNLIRRIKGYVIISCYDSALYKEMLSDWRSFLQKTVNNRTTPSEETIYISPNIPAPEI